MSQGAQTGSSIAFASHYEALRCPHGWQTTLVCHLSSWPTKPSVPHVIGVGGKSCREEGRLGPSGFWTWKLFIRWSFSCFFFRIFSELGWHRVKPKGEDRRRGPQSEPGSRFKRPRLDRPVALPTTETMCRCGKTCARVSVGLGLLLSIAGRGGWKSTPKFAQRASDGISWSEVIKRKNQRKPTKNQKNLRKARKNLRKPKKTNKIS